MNIFREYAQSSKNTFDILPINKLINRYWNQELISVDLFSRNQKYATYTNDLIPDTTADYHMDVLDFLKVMKSKNVGADIVFFDPPYSLRQMKECYENIGNKITQRESQFFYGDVRNGIDEILRPGGIVISFGWNSIGMGKKRNYEILEILLVCHGRAHNDTICVVDKKSTQLKLEGTQ